MRHFLLALTTIFLTLTSVYSQSVSGYVKNSEDEFLPFATVMVPELDLFTTTDNRGKYELTLPLGRHTLRFQFIGYDVHELEIFYQGEPVELDVVLTKRSFDLNEIVVSGGRDPAYYIMERVVENRHHYIQNPQSYKCETYLRITLEEILLDTLDIEEDSIETHKMLHFVESYGVTWFEQPNKVKEIKEAYKDRSPRNTERHRIGRPWDYRRQSGEAAARDHRIFYSSVAEADFNLYRNFINVERLGPVPFVSPVSGTATLLYRFRLLNSFIEDDRLIHRIEITPRNREGALFSGNIYIVEGDWAIAKFDLQINSPALHFFDSFRVKREYQLLEDGHYLPSGEEFFYTIRRGRDKIIQGNTLVYYSDFEVDPEIPTNFFRNELKVTLPGAYDKDTLFWENERRHPLGEREAEFVRELDSIINWHRSEEYLRQQDSIFNRLKPLDFLIFGVGFHNSFQKRTLFFNPLISSVRPFGVDGFRFALSGYYTREFSKADKLSFNGGVDYGFANSDIKGHGRLRYLYNPRRLSSAYFRHGNIYSQINTYESITATFSRGNYVNKIYYGLGHRTEIANGVMLKIGTEYAKRLPIDALNLSTWWEDIFGEEYEPRAFDPYNEWIIDLEMEITPRQKFYTEPYRKVIIGSNWPTFTINYKKAIPGVMDATINYDYLELSAKQNLRIAAFGTSRWQVFTGKFLNKADIRLTDERFFRGSDRYIFSNPLNSFQLLGPTIATTGTYVHVNYLHNFQGTLLNKLPLLRRLHLNAVGGVGALYIHDENLRHAESWVGFERPFRIQGQLFKIGIYGVTANSNHSDLDATLKIGIDFFNAFRGEWSY